MSDNNGDTNWMSVITAVLFAYTVYEMEQRAHRYREAHTTLSIDEHGVIGERPVTMREARRATRTSSDREFIGFFATLTFSTLVVLVGMIILYNAV